MFRRAVGCLLLAALCLAPAPVRAANVLLVTGSSTLTSDETARQTAFQGWGHTVTTIVDSDSAANFNTAMAAVDVVYVPMTVQEWELTTKVKTTTKGVVCEERYLDVEMGFSTADGWNANHNQTEVLVNSHAVTTGLSTGYVTITTSNQELAMMNATVATGMTILSKQNYTAGNMLGVIDTGGALAGGGTAAARRVRMPWGGDNFAWSSLNSSGLLIAQQAIAWAANNPLLLHWKLDHTSGTTVTDSSGNARTGTVNGTATWISGRNSNGLDLNGATKAEITNLLGNPSNFTLACWARIDGADTSGAEGISIGDNIRLRLHHGASSAPRVSFYTGSGYRNLTGTGNYVGAGWHHFAATFDDATNTMTLYVNGVLNATLTTTNSVSWAALGTKTVVGSHGNGSTSFDLDGAIDDVLVYNKALTLAEIKQLYGLVGHWKLDETSGTTAADSSGLGNNGTVTGTATWTTGARGNGFSANYTNGQDYIEIPNSTSLENVQEDNYTLAGWFKPANLPPGTGSDNTANYRIIGKSGWHCGLLYNNAGNLHNEHWLAPTPTWAGAGAWSTNPPGRFYHTACVVDRSLGSIKFYLDGTLTGTTTFTANSVAYDYGTEPWRIGVSNPFNSTWGHAANGVLDDVRVYNRTLTAEEIAEIYGLVGHWKLDEASGTTAADSSGLGNTGTFTNGALPNTTAIYSKGATFDGVNDFVNVPNTVNRVNLRESMTVSCWARSHTANWNQTGCLVSKRDQFVLHPWSGGKSFDFYINSGGWTSASTNLANISNFDLMDWHHYVGVYNHVTGQFQVFVDGVQRATNSITAGSNLTSDTGPITIGYDDGQSGRYFDGDLDDVRIYNRALPASEIAELYGLKYWYKFDETSGSTANDSGPYTNNATINAGAASWITGRSGNAMAFNGASNLASSLAIYPPTSGTVAFWMRVAANPSSVGRIFGSSDDFEFRHMDSGATEVTPYGLIADLHITGTNNSFITTGAINSPNKWYYVTAVFNDATDTYALYIDGVLQSSGTRIMNPAAAALLSIGTRTGSTQYYTGDLEELQIYSREMSATEVYAKYRELKPPGVRLIKWIEVR